MRGDSPRDDHSRLILNGSVDAECGALVRAILFFLGHIWMSEVAALLGLTHRSQLNCVLYAQGASPYTKRHMRTRPKKEDLIGKKPSEVPLSLQRIFASSEHVPTVWIGAEEAKKLSKDDIRAYEAAHAIMCHLSVQAPTAHQSGHPGGPLSSFTFAYFLSKKRNPSIDQPLRISAGHLSLLSYGLQWLFGREGKDKRLASPQAIIDSFRKPDGLPGHVEASIGDIPFGTGPLGKGVTNALGAAFGLKYQMKPGIVDVLLADGDSQEGQVQEAFRLAAHLQLDNLVVDGDFNDIQISDMPSKVVACDFASIASATGWQVIEVQNGND